MHAESDEHLVRYLLGELSEADTEALDERSITDDAFALRLQEIENELADQYARGELADETLQRFARATRTLPHVREKVDFAHALHAVAAPARATPIAGRKMWLSTRSAAWGLAAASVVLLLAAGYLAMRNLELRLESARAEARRTTLQEQNAQLQQDLERSQTALSQRNAPTIATAVLGPPRRGVDPETTVISIAPSADRLELRLQIETDEDLTFWAGLRDPATNRVVWRSPDVRSEARDADRMVTVTIPRNALTSQRYTVELSGSSRGGVSEVLANYPLRVVLE